MLNNKIKGITSLIGAILTDLLIGNLLGFGNYIPYLRSYIHYNGNDIEDKYLYFIGPIGIAISDILPIVVNSLDNFYGTRFLLLISIILLLISQLLFYNEITKFKWLIFAYVLFGISKSLTYLPLMKNCWKYYPNKKGLITGLILSAFGLSAFILISICDEMVNPNDIKAKNNIYSKEIANKFIDFIMLYIYLIIIIGIIVIFLVFPFEDENSIENVKDNNYLKFDSPIITKDTNNDEEQITNSLQKQSFDISNEDIKEKEIYPTLLECLCSKQFLICLITVGCTTIFGFLLTNTYRNFGEKKINEEKALKYLSKFYTLINTFGRILWGIILDKFGFTIPYFIVCLIQIICSAFFYISANSIYTYFIVCCFGAFSFAGHVTLFPNAINKKFGVENSVVLLGICGVLTGISCLLGPVLTFFIIKEVRDYMIPYFITCGTGIVSAILTWFFEYKKFEIKNDIN